MPKMTIKTLNERVESKFDRIDNSFKDLLGSIAKLTSQLANTDATVKRILAKHTSEIRVLEKDGSWGGYTGVFYTTKSDISKVVEDKAMKHYDTYFEGREFYSRKTLALFILNDKGKKLVKILQDPDNRLHHYPNLKEATVKSLKEYFKNGGVDPKCQY
tara:strand:+ start:205 stop:681 length:477 start_codon:yes stop_codon:yes gene_type:complete